MGKMNQIHTFNDDKTSSEYRVSSCPTAINKVEGYTVSEWGWIQYLHWQWIRETPIRGAMCLCMRIGVEEYA